MQSIRSLGLAATVTAAAALALTAIAAGSSAAADPFVAGQPSSRSLPVDPTARGKAVQRLEALSVRLGLPAAARHAVERLDDRFEHATYDQVTAFDGRGQAVGLARYELDGRLRVAVRLGWHLDQRGGPAVDAATAGRLARAAVAAAGISVDGEPAVQRQTAGWQASWARLVGGVPVPGDGVRVALWADGSFHSLSRTERPLAATPAAVLDRAEVRARAEARLDAMFGPAERSGLRVAGLDLAWVAPNDTFAAALPDAPESTVRLAWVVGTEVGGPVAERLQALELWLDAGDGRLLGGDVLR